MRDVLGAFRRIIKKHTDGQLTEHQQDQLLWALLNWLVETGGIATKDAS